MTYTQHGNVIWITTLRVVLNFYTFGSLMVVNYDGHYFCLSIKGYT